MSIETPIRKSSVLLDDRPVLSTFYSNLVEPNFIVGTQKAHFIELFGKRVFDIACSVLMLLMLSPLLVLVALIVRISSPGPVIYRSLRVGKNQKLFYMYKFRTMVDNAHQLRAQLCKEANLENQLFKLKKDVRVTPVGAFLRKFSLDEFPQLFHVLKGEMSLVGPRPYIPEESALFKAPYTMRFLVVPGVTGPWQVSGRSDLTFQQLCELELEYVQRWSLMLDIGLFLKTIPAVLLKKGAY